MRNILSALVYIIAALFEGFMGLHLLLPLPSPFSTILSFLWLCAVTIVTEILIIKTLE